MKKRVVITGMGVISPYGVGTDKYWEGIISGKSCIGYTEGIDERNIVKISGQIKDFVPEEYIDLKESRRNKQPRSAFCSDFMGYYVTHNTYKTGKKQRFCLFFLWGNLVYIEVWKYLIYFLYYVNI